LKSFLLLLAFLTHAGPRVHRVAIPAPGGVTLDAALVQPDGPPHGPAVVALHGCSGPFASRDGSWAVVLAHAGHIVLLPDSFGSRGLGSQCEVADRSVDASHVRRGDAIAAATWLSRQPGTPPGGIDLVGWSNGGTTVMYTVARQPDLPSGLFRRFVAFYPGCRTESQDARWQPSGPLMILVGALDDWTPAGPCRTVAARFPHLVTLVVQPDAYHDFDAPDRPVTEHSGLATPPGGTGHAHTGTNAAARQDALRRVPAFLDAAE
jgi:dienelactone hydrolase